MGVIGVIETEVGISECLKACPWLGYQGRYSWAQFYNLVAQERVWHWSLKFPGGELQFCISVAYGPFHSYEGCVTFTMPPLQSGHLSHVSCLWGWHNLPCITQTRNLEVIHDLLFFTDHPIGATSLLLPEILVLIPTLLGRLVPPLLVFLSSNPSLHIAARAIFSKQDPIIPEI